MPIHPSSVTLGIRTQAESTSRPSASRVVWGAYRSRPQSRNWYSSGISIRQESWSNSTGKHRDWFFSFSPFLRKPMAERISTFPPSVSK